MKKNKMMVGATVASLLLMGISAEAKFGIKIPKASSGGGDISGLKADLEGDLSAAILDCKGARLSFIKAQEDMLNALGLKEKCQTKMSEMKSLMEGNTSASDLKKASVISEEINAEIAAGTKVVGELSLEQKVEFSKGTGYFVWGMALEAKQVHVAVKLGEMAKEITEKASGLDKAAAAAVAMPALEIASMIPGDIKEATSTMGLIVDFCKKQNIKIPNPKTVDDLI